MADVTDSISNPPIRFALVGCGSIANTQIKALLALSPAVELVFVCDRIAERASALADEFSLQMADFEAICADATIDAVTVCTPTGAHAELAIQAIEAGKHVIVEKPMDVSFEVCLRLKNAAEASGKLCSVISQHRYDPASTALYPGYPVSLGVFGRKGSALIEGDELKTLAIKGEETLSGSGANAHAVQVATGGTRSASAQAETPSDAAWKWGDAHREQFRDFLIVSVRGIHSSLRLKMVIMRCTLSSPAIVRPNLENGWFCCS